MSNTAISRRDFLKGTASLAVAASVTAVLGGTASELTDTPLLKSGKRIKRSLSPRACAGILRRAKRRGKKLPESFERALMKQTQLGQQL